MPFVDKAQTPAQIFNRRYPNKRVAAKKEGVSLTTIKRIMRVTRLSPGTPVSTSQLSIFAAAEPQRDPFIPYGLVIYQTPDGLVRAIWMEHHAPASR